MTAIRLALRRALACAAALQLLLLAACSTKLETPEGAIITCQSSSECPGGFRCQESRCISTTGNQEPRLVLNTASRGAVTVPLDVTVLDAELEDVSVTAEYAVEEGGSFGAWAPATLEGAAGLSSRQGTNGHTLTWNAVADAGVGLSTWLSMPDPDAADGTEVLAAARVKVRLTPVDAHGLAGATVESAPFLVGDSPAQATFSPVPADLGGIAVLQPALSDAESDPVDLLVQFRGAAGEGWRAAAVVVGDTQGLSSAPGVPGVVHPIAWDTAAAADDLHPSAPQGLGSTNHPAAELRLGTRHVVGGVEVHGAWSAPVTVAVVNQTAPRVIALEVRRGVLTPGRSPIAVTYQVADEESDPVDARVTYSIDGGVTFTPCPELPVPQSEGLLGLATAPVTDGGIWHTFVWDAGAGLELPASVVVQVEVANRLAAGGALAGRIGAAQVILPETLATWPSVIGSAFEEHDFPVPGSLGEVVVVDFDGDALVDLAAVWRDFGTSRIRLSVQRGVAGAGALGISGFGAATAFDLGADPGYMEPYVKLTWADVDGDGRGDLVVHADHLAGWLRGLAGGAFAAFAPFTAATDLAGGFCLGDWNEDGLPDVALTYGVETEDTHFGIQLQLATAPGVFATATRLETGSAGVFECATVDLDADGHRDLALSDYAHGTRVLAGDGHGGFSDLASWRSLAFSAAGYAVADVDGDGLEDLVIAGFGYPIVDVWLGSEVTPLPDPRTFSTAGGFPSDVATVDLDGDGRLDLVTNESLLRQTHEPGVFATGARLSSYGRAFAGVTPGGLPFAAILSSSPTTTLKVFHRAAQDAWPTFAAAAEFRSHANPFVFSVSAEDVNLDGRPDLSNLGSFTLDALLGSGRAAAADGNYSPAATYLDVYYGREARWADLDGDGVTDLVTNGITRVTAVPRAPGPDFASTTVHDTLVYEDGAFDGSYLRQLDNSLLVEDLDGDAEPEIVTSRTTVDGSGNPLDRRIVLLHAGPAALVKVAEVVDGSVAGLAFVPPRRIDAGDVDGDGLVDLAVASAETPASPPAFERTIRLYRQTAAGVFAANGTVALPAGETGARELRLLDLDDDGIPDLVVAGAQTVHVYRGLGANGRGTFGFQAPTAYTVGLNPYQVVPADLDGDGVLDLAVATGAGTIDLLRGGASQGLATGTFSAQPSLTCAASISAVAADLNGDGYEDLATGTQTGTTVFLAEPRRMLAWQTRSLSASGGAPGTLRAPGYVRPAEVDAFGARPPPDLVGYHLAREGLAAFERRVRASAGRGLGLVPLGTAQEVTGRLRLARRRWPDASSPPRLAVEVRLGPAPGGAPWVEVPLPVAAARAGTSWATADVVVVQEAVDWLRASEVAADPASGTAGASTHLPLLTGADGQPHELLVPRRSMTIVPRDADGDLATGTGPRFVVDTGASPPVIRVLATELGTFRAYLRH